MASSTLPTLLCACAQLTQRFHAIVVQCTSPGEKQQPSCGRLWLGASSSDQPCTMDEVFNMGGVSPSRKGKHGKASKNGRKPFSESPKPSTSLAQTALMSFPEERSEEDLDLIYQYLVHVRFCKCTLASRPLRFLISLWGCGIGHGTAATCMPAFLQPPRLAVEPPLPVQAPEAVDAFPQHAHLQAG